MINYQFWYLFKYHPHNSPSNFSVPTFFSS
jgi:hypothetical protein